MAPPISNDREALRQHFNQIAPDQQANGWNEMWQKKVTPWDRGTPNPAFADTLEAHSQYFGPSGGVGKRALVPGCGRGYDVFLLAAHGYDAFGLDSSPLAIESARALVGAEDFEQRYPLRDGVDSRGTASFVKADFFANDFFAETEGGKFDLIYDYTFLCALPPPLRPKWAKRMNELLAPGGYLVCVEFPLQKDPKLGGPPHGLSKELYEELFSRPGHEVVYDEAGCVRPDGSGGVAKDALERVQRLTATRTHVVGQDPDCVSIWRHVRR